MFLSLPLTPLTPRTPATHRQSMLSLEFFDKNFGIFSRTKNTKNICTNMQIVATQQEREGGEEGQEKEERGGGLGCGGKF